MTPEQIKQKKQQLEAELQNFLPQAQARIISLQAQIQLLAEMEQEDQPKAEEPEAEVAA